MIEKAVELRPDDGYIVDSLAGRITGWAIMPGRSNSSKKSGRAGAAGSDDQRPSG